MPEEANTISAGVVVTPHWVDGLSFSIDYFNINIKGEDIFATSQQHQVLQNCSPTLKATLRFIAPISSLATAPAAAFSTIIEPDGNGVAEAVLSALLLPSVLPKRGAELHLLNDPAERRVAA